MLFIMSSTVPVVTTMKGGNSVSNESHFATKIMQNIFHILYHLIFITII